MKKKVADLAEGDVLIGPLTGVPRFTVRSVSVTEEGTANLDLGRYDGTDLFGSYNPVEMPLDAEVEILG